MLLLGTKFWSRVSYVFMKPAFLFGQLFILVSAGLLGHVFGDVPEGGFSVLISLLNCRWLLIVTA